MKKQRVFYPLYFVLVASLAALVALTSGCAIRSKPVLVTGNVALFESLAAIQDAADELTAKKVITPEQRKELASRLLPALETGRALAKLTAEWPADKPAPAEIQALIGQLRGIVQLIVEQWPASPGRDALTAKLNLAQSAALAFVTLFVR